MAPSARRPPRRYRHAARWCPAEIPRAIWHAARPPTRAPRAVRLVTTTSQPVRAISSISSRQVALNWLAEMRAARLTAAFESDRGMDESLLWSSEYDHGHKRAARWHGRDLVHSRPPGGDARARDQEPASSMTQLELLLTALHEGNVEFIIVGGAAARAHGSSRLIDDLDVAFARSPANPARLVKSLAPFTPYLRAAWLAIRLVRCDALCGAQLHAHGQGRRNRPTRRNHRRWSVPRVAAAYDHHHRVRSRTATARPAVNCSRQAGRWTAEGPRGDCRTGSVAGRD